MHLCVVTAPVSSRPSCHSFWNTRTTPKETEGFGIAVFEFKSIEHRATFKTDFKSTVNRLESLLSPDEIDDFLAESKMCFKYNNFLVANFRPGGLRDVILRCGIHAWDKKLWILLGVLVPLIAMWASFVMMGA